MWTVHLTAVSAKQAGRRAIATGIYQLRMKVDSKAGDNNLRYWNKTTEAKGSRETATWSKRWAKGQSNALVLSGKIQLLELVLLLPNNCCALILKPTLKLQSLF